MNEKLIKKITNKYKAKRAIEILIRLLENSESLEKYQHIDNLQDLKKFFYSR